MKNIVKKVVIGVVCVGCVFAAQAKTTYRDSLGRKQGTAEVDRYGKTIYRDSLGRKQGTAETVPARKVVLALMYARGCFAVRECVD